MTMIVPFNVTFDAEDPHAQAAFWAEALGYIVEDNTPLIRRLLEAGVAGDDDVTDVDGHPAWRSTAAIRNPVGAVDEATGMGLGGRLLFQVVPEPKAVKNRVHLDLSVGADARPAYVERLVKLGATFVAEHDHWLTLADPEGNEFDVQ
jgi:hypothetical protein